MDHDRLVAMLNFQATRSLWSLQTASVAVSIRVYKADDRRCLSEPNLIEGPTCPGPFWWVTAPRSLGPSPSSECECWFRHGVRKDYRARDEWSSRRARGWILIFLSFNICLIDEIKITEYWPNNRHLQVYINAVERVTSFKLLGIHISSNMKWDAQIEFCSCKLKSASRLHFLKFIKRASSNTGDLVCFYTTSFGNMRALCGIPVSRRNSRIQLESQQIRAMRIIFGDISYDEALDKWIWPAYPPSKIAVNQ